MTRKEYSFTEYIETATRYAHDNPHERSGQAYFNSLYSYCPVIADAVRATKIDPFHNDVNINSFLEFVNKSLEDVK